MWESHLVEWNPIDCPLHPSVAHTGWYVHSRQLDLAPSPLTHESIGLNSFLPLLWPVVGIAWSSATCSDDRNLRVGCIEGEVVRSFSLELSAHHHRPLAVHHSVRGHPHAGRQHLSWIMVAQLALLNIAPEFSGILSNLSDERSYFPSTTTVQGLSAMAKLGVPKATANHLVAGPEIVMLASPPVTFAFKRTCVFVRAVVAS